MLPSTVACNLNISTLDEHLDKDSKCIDFWDAFKDLNGFIYTNVLLDFFEELVQEEFYIVNGLHCFFKSKSWTILTGTLSFIEIKS